MLRLYRKSIRFPYIGLSVFMLIVMMVIIGWTTYSKTSAEAYANTERFGRDVLTQASLHLNRYFEAYDQAFRFLESSPEFESWARQDSVPSSGDAAESEAELIRQLNVRYLTPFIQAHPEVLSITLYNGNKDVRRVYSSNQLDSFGNELWLKELVPSSKLAIIPVESDSYAETKGSSEHAPVISLVRKIPFGSSYGTIHADITLSPLIPQLGDMELTRGGDVFLLDQSGRFLAGTGSGEFEKKVPADRLISQTNGFYRSTESKELISFQTVPYPGWRVVAVLPDTIASDTVNLVLRPMTGITAFGVLLYVLLLYSASTRLTERIVNLRRTIKMSLMGKWDSRAEVHGEDEIADLAHSYNRLLDQLNRSAATLEETKGTERKAVIHAMQSQIGSHFLYNTLECINAMAVLSGHKPIEKTTVALSDMLRYISSFQNPFVTLDQEIKHTLDYLHIVQIRFGSKVQYSIQMDEATANIRCLKAAIQPIVENCVKHAVETKGTSVHIGITLSRWQERYMQISVMDNGGGFEASALEELQRQLKVPDPETQLDRYSRIGLLNVHYRIRMSFPDPACGIHLETLRSEEERLTGTGRALVRIVIPCTPFC